MGRLAGDGNTYSLQDILETLNRRLGYSIDLVSVTTILDAMPFPPSAMAWRGYKLATEAVVEAVKEGADLSEFDVETLYELLKTQKKVTPITRLREEADRGTAVHTLFENFVLGNDLVRPLILNKADYEGYVQSFVKWADDSGFTGAKVLGVELPVFSLTHRYAGTLDLVYEVDGEVCVMDAKTAKQVREKHLIQVAAYAHALEEMGVVDKVHHKEVVCFRANGGYSSKRSACTLDDFLDVARIHTRLARMKQEMKETA